MSIAKKNSDKPDNGRDDNGKTDRAPATWDSLSRLSESERGGLMLQFHVWFKRTREEAEREEAVRETTVRELAPLARAALDTMESPEDCRLMVLDFTVQALAWLDAQHRLSVLDTYHRAPAGFRGDVAFVIEEGNEAAAATLWQWFLEYRKSRKGEAG
jgi:hypothetical protein